MFKGDGEQVIFLNTLLYSEDTSRIKEHSVLLPGTACVFVQPGSCALSDARSVILALREDLLTLCDTLPWGLVKVECFSGEIRLCYNSYFVCRLSSRLVLCQNRFAYSLKVRRKFDIVALTVPK